MVVNSNYYGVKRVGDTKAFRISTHPRSSQLLFFAFKDLDIDALAARTAFEKYFQDSSLTAYCITSRDFERPIVIEALFSNPDERRKVLKSRNDEVVFTKRDGSPIYATVYTPLPGKPYYRVYTVHKWMLSSVKDTKKDVKEAIIRRLESIATATEHAKRKKREASISENAADADAASIWEAEADKETPDIRSITESIKDCGIEDCSAEDVEECIEDILIPSRSSIYNSGTVTIILSKAASLYSRHISPVGHYLFSSNQKYRLSTPTKHYLYCRKCRSLDVHSTDECTK